MAEGEEEVDMLNTASNRSPKPYRGGRRKFCFGGQILTVAREARAKFLGTRPFS